MVDGLLKNRIQEDMKAAMRAKEQKRLDVIRLLLAAMKQREVDERIVLSDAQIVQIVDKMIKQRRESIVQYEAGARQDLVAQESYEIEQLQNYLPPPLTDGEVESLIQAAIKETGAATVKDMGKLMNALRPQLQGRANMETVSQKIKALLGQ